MRAWVGLWTSPSLTDEAADALVGILGPYGFDEFSEAVEILQRQLSGQLPQWRPQPAELLDVLRRVRRSRADRAEHAAADAAWAREHAAQAAMPVWLGGLQAARQALADAGRARSTAA